MKNYSKKIMNLSMKDIMIRKNHLNIYQCVY